MRTILLQVLVVASLAACAPTATQAPLAQAGGPRVAARGWTDVDAESDLRRALARRGSPLEVIEGPMVPVGYDPARVVAWTDGGTNETLAGPGAWRFVTAIGEYWVFENGVVLVAR